MTYAIEKGIPLPGERGSDDLPLEVMETGDSFAVPLAEAPDLKERRRITNRVRAAIAKKRHKETGKKFIARLVDGERALRVWRVK
jgi:hypothetical protein